MTEPNEPNDQPTPADDNDADDTTIEDSALDPRTREAFKKLRSENHSLRTRLRDSEEQVGIASARLSAHHRQVIAAAAKAAGLIDPTDFTAAHPDPSEFLDEFHEVVGDKVAEAAKALIAAKPYLARPPSGPPPTERPIEGLRPGARAPEDKVPAPTWASAIRGTGH